MRSIATLLLCTSISLGAAAQTTIANGGFETWGNTSPGLSTEPTNYYSNKSGSAIAQLANATCFQETSSPHSGTYCVRLETINYLGISVVNGSLTTGVVNAPSTDKARGYIGTVNYSNSSDVRRMAFTGRPDSLVGWYKYTQGGASEQGKVRVILHTGDYNDPEVSGGSPADYPNLSANKIADATWLTPASNVTTWTRFSVPLNYVSTSSPAYIMINMTPSANQMTSVAGSKIWFDDLEVVYTPTVACAAPTGIAATGVTSNAATLNWTATGAAASQYVLNTSSTAPTGYGTNTTATTYNASGLAASTTYYFHLRDTCATALHSAWTTTSFTTLPPVSVSTVANADFDMTSFPNPVKDEVTVRVNGANAAGMLHLMDMSGRIISSVAANTATLSMSTSGLAAGLYLIRYTDGAHTKTIKITKQ